MNGREVLDAVMIGIQGFANTHGENPLFHMVNEEEYRLLEGENLTRGSDGQLQVWGVDIIAVRSESITDIAEILEAPE